MIATSTSDQVTEDELPEFLRPLHHLINKYGNIRHNGDYLRFYEAATDVEFNELYEFETRFRPLYERSHAWSGASGGIVANRVACMVYFATGLAAEVADMIDVRREKEIKSDNRY